MSVKDNINNIILEIKIYFKQNIRIMLQSEFEKRARAMADGDDEPLTENEKHALRNSTVTDDGRHTCGKKDRQEFNRRSIRHRCL